MTHDDIDYISVKIVPTGSRVICNPPPMDTDRDYIVLLDTHFDAEFIAEHMEGFGYDSDGMETYDVLCELDSGGWGSFRKGDVNYIMTFDEDFFDKFVLATNIAEKLNLLKKEDRIILFKYILYEADLW